MTALRCASEKRPEDLPHDLPHVPGPKIDQMAL